MQAILEANSTSSFSTRSTITQNENVHREFQTIHTIKLKLAAYDLTKSQAEGKNSRIRKELQTLAQANHEATKSMNPHSSQISPHLLRQPENPTPGEQIRNPESRATVRTVQPRRVGFWGDLERRVRTRKGFLVMTPAKRETAGPRAISAYPTPAATVIFSRRGSC